jgi:transposase
MAQLKVPLKLTNEDRATLESWVRRGTTAQRLALRARIILRCANSENLRSIARALDVSAVTVGKWRRRFSEEGVDGLLDLPRPGIARKITDENIEKLLVSTLESKPVDATHWSTRDMAKHAGISHSSVGRIWRAFGLQPHRSETFKLSTDPLFVDKVRDIVGLYMNPPEHAIVLCVDEKSQIQALDRTQPLLPMRPGQAERRTHDYARHGTTSLFAALDVANGKVIGKTYRHHRATEYRKFLNEINRSIPEDLQVHLIVDNYSTHKTAAIQRWHARHPRFHVHFTPTYSSWLNLVERWFALLTERQLKRGIHRSTAELELAIKQFVETHNANPKPFIWTKTADQILEKLGRFCQRTLELHVDKGISDPGH